MNTDCCCQPSTNTNACGCCEGVEPLTPFPTENRPGLPALSYRIGTHATFLETMKARLSSSDYSKLAELTTREDYDPSIAMLDAWSTVADVLTFYQERIANEGYLRTATERRSVLELARLIGYQPRPGVSSSVYLAYTLDDNFKEEAIILKGARSQSIPGPDEFPQSFEVSEDLKARAKWNNLKPRTSMPQEIKFDQALRITEIYLKGITTFLKPNDPLLLVYGEKAGEKILRRVKAVNVDFDNDRTEVVLQELPLLICVFVDFLRGMVKTISADIAKYFENGNSEPLIAYLGIILDNLSLGSYPPLHKTYFSHDRIYYFLRPNTSRLAISLEKHTNVNGFVQLLRDETEIDKLVMLVMEQAQNSLKKFRQEIICLFRYFLQQVRPSDPAEQKILIEVVCRYIQSLIEYFSSPAHEWNKVESALKTLLKDSELLDDPDLHKDLNELLDLLSEETEKVTIINNVLKAIKEWLKSISVNNSSVLCDTAPAPRFTSLDELISPSSPLIQPPTIQIANSLRLSRNIGNLLASNTRAAPEMLINFQPRLKPVLYQAWANATVGAKQVAQLQIQEDTDENKSLISIHALRLSAALFGNNAPVKMVLVEPSPPIDGIKLVSVPATDDWDPSESKAEEKPTRLYLDNAYDNIVEGTHVVVNNSHIGMVTVARADKVTVRPRTAYTISGKTTQIELSKEWWQPQAMDSLRKTMVYVETEKLSLAMMPDKTPVSGQSVDLQALYGGLPSDRWVIVSGELSNVPGDTAGVKMAELALVSAVELVFDDSLPGGDKTHTKITFDKNLVNSFKRDTVTIYGNVVRATHGETRKEVLGSGDGAKALQAFVLKQPPLTFVSASNPTGVDSTLSIFVNDIKWQETDTLAGLSFTDRNFITKTDNEGKTTVIFGNGREGARLPTGIENIKAEYRNGIGKQGNVKAEQITLLTTSPLGVKAVTNPNAASGGADKETRDQARKNAPLATMTLDRLVSVQDYEDFSRLYAGIGKARAVEISDGRRQLVHITIAGTDDIPIDKSSDLYRNLRQALLDFGDPYQAIQLEIRELMLIVISAGIRILPDYQWEPVVTQVRSTLLDAFSFDRRELGQDVLLSEVMSVMQRVPGVAYVDVDTFGGIPEMKLDEITNERRLLKPEEISSKVQDFVKKIKPRLQVNLAGYKDNDGNIEKDTQGNIVLHPAQLAFLTPEVPETLILNQII